MTPQAANWAGNITFGARQLHRPRTVEELQTIVASSDHVRALGSGHSFNRIADTTGDLVSVADLPATVEIAGDKRSARVSGGMKYGMVAQALQANGLALHNLGSLPHISVAGAVSTGTHGSGVGNGSLSTAVNSVELVTADGSIAILRRGDPGFPGAVISLGALGIITHLTLDLEPSYEVDQTVYVDLPRTELHRSFEAIMASAYSVSLFTGWQGGDLVDMAWLKRRVDRDGAAPGQDWHGAVPATRAMHPIPSLPGDEATQQLGVRGPWNERLPHFRMEFTPSNGDELQSEYFVARDVAVEAIAALEPLSDRIAPALMIGEIRTVAADELWLSPAYQRDSVALHFTWLNDTPAVLPVLTAMEAALAPYGARPHWGKVFTLAPERVRALYPHFADFQQLQAEFDPNGVFRNEFLEPYLG
ncbi:MAG: alditol oxidase [Frankiales bacterium]|nr:alditol oxidase [Frankiales bacterium]